MKVVHISDTHGHHKKINIPECDLLIFSGDWSHHGRFTETKEFFKWIIVQPAKHIVIIPGNHEATLCPILKNKCRGIDILEEFYVSLLNREAKIVQLINNLPKHVHFLFDNYVIIEGYKIYGTPWVKEFPAGNITWGFQAKTELNLLLLYQMIPQDVDILITHEAPYGTLDLVRGEHEGSKSLAENIIPFLKNLKLHAFGHIHQERGTDENFGMVESYSGLKYSNGSVLTHKHDLVVIIPNIIEI